MATPSRLAAARAFRLPRARLPRPWARLEATIALYAERAFRRYPRLARSPAGYPLRQFIARQMRRLNLFDVYRLDCVDDVTFARGGAVDYLKGAHCPALLAPLTDIANYRARFGLAVYDDAAAHYACLGYRMPAVHGGFDPALYRRDNPDVDRQGLNPSAHFLWRGIDEARWQTTPNMPGPEPDFAMLRLRGTSASRACVIVPVHNGRTQTLRCLHSVLTAPCASSHRLLVIDDASDDVQLVCELQALAARGLIELLRNTRNSGFSASVNAGLAQLTPGEHAVLLNSDAAVYGDWIDRLLRVTEEGDRVGTVTPLSSSATILSYPVVLRDNPQPLEIAWERLDAMVRDLDAAPLPIPTGVGSCMLITADCLSETGLLDAAAFPSGYGEENDFCCRAAALGWRHLAATNTFVYHEGAASFATRRAALVEAGLKIINQRYPHYRRAIAQHIAADPLAPLRQTLDCRRIAESAPQRRLWHWIGPTPPSDFRSTDLRLFKRADGLLRLHCPAVPVTPNLPDIKLPQDTLKIAGLLRTMGVVGVQLHGRSWLGGTLASLASVAASVDTTLV